jgi:hypothetical protein
VLSTPVPTAVAAEPPLVGSLGFPVEASTDGGGVKAIPASVTVKASAAP